MVESFDQELNSLMDDMFKTIKRLDSSYSDAEVRCLIVAHNMRGLANALIIIDEAGETLDLKRTALGLLGTADWLKGDIEYKNEVK